MAEHVGYSALMGEAGAYLKIRLDLSEPIEIGDFASLFAGFGSEFDRHLRREQPTLAGTARMYVSEVQKGSIVAHLIADIPDLVGLMDDALIVLGFGALFSQRLRDLIQGKHLPGATKSELKDMMATVKAVAHDKSGNMTLEGIRYSDGLFRTDFEATFTTAEVRQAILTIEDQRDELDKVERADRERVLMTFTRSGVTPAKLGKRSGDLVRIEEISPKPLALVYASDMAEERLKHEIREADDNVFKKAFLVDVNIKTANGGNPVAYAVTTVHDVIDLPEED